jgi:hypothetical protein
MDTQALEQPVTSIFRIELSWSEDGGSRFFQNNANYLPGDVMSQPEECNLNINCDENPRSSYKMFMRKIYYI